MEDHHVDRPGVEAQQCVKLTGTNRSFGLIQNLPSHAVIRSSRATPTKPRRQTPHSFARDQRTENRSKLLISVLCPPFRRPGGHGEGPYTRSHPELGRENPQRQWYCVLRRGRVGRRQVFRTEDRDQRTENRRKCLWPLPRAPAQHSSPQNTEQRETTSVL